jgi:hypothetical protein
MEDLQKKQGEKKNSTLEKILFSSLALVALLLVELYLLIAMTDFLPGIAVVAVLILGCAYLDLSACGRRMLAKDQSQEEQYASILKAEKASYLLIRKYFDEIEAELSVMEDRFAVPFQEVVAAQKATAKVTISRNKENTDALMNSNDKMQEVIFSIQDSMEKLSTIINENFGNQDGDKSAELLLQQTHIQNQLREMELGLKNEILQAVNQLSNAPRQMAMTSMPMPEPVDAAPQEEPELGNLPDFSPLEADVQPEDEPIVEEPEAMPELEPIAEEEPVIEEPEAMPELEPIVEEEPVIEEPEAMPELEPIAEEEPVIEEPEAMPELEPIAEEEPEPIVEPEPEPEPEPLPEPEPVAQEVPPMPDMSDPNKMMSPDDIAALLANLSSEPVAEEPEPEPEPEPLPEPEPESKELPPMPDMSDPNRAMSPDEIAALFANLG